MIIKNLLAPNKYSFWTAVFWTLLILFFCFKSPSSGEEKIYFPNADKVVHFTFYVVFVVLWFRYLVFKKSIHFKDKVRLVIAAILLGIAIEIGQHFFTTTRQADAWDVVANTIGSMVGIWVSIFIFESEKK